MKPRMFPRGPSRLLAQRWQRSWRAFAGRHLHRLRCAPYDDISPCKQCRRCNAFCWRLQQVVQRIEDIVTIRLINGIRLGHGCLPKMNDGDSRTRNGETVVPAWRIGLGQTLGQRQRRKEDPQLLRTRGLNLERSRKPGFQVKPARKNTSTHAGFHLSENPTYLSCWTTEPGWHPGVGIGG